jgi:hypothetical protein
MSTKRRASNFLVIGSLLFAPTFAQSQDAPTKPHVPLEKTIGQVTPTGPVPSLAVLNAAGAKLESGKLTLVGVSPNAIVFADRPVRAAGHVMTEQFIMQWDEGKDNFAIDPPNATVSILGGDGSKVSDAVVTLRAPKIDGGNLTFEVSVLEGNLAGSSGPAALFIDHFGGFAGGGFRAGGFGGFHAAGIGGFRAEGFDAARVGGFRGGAWDAGRYWHAPVYHGAWYGSGAGVAAGVAAGAALGAAATANPYLGYSAYCGYYPYPPCY